MDFRHIHQTGLFHGVQWNRFAIRALVALIGASFLSASAGPITFLYRGTGSGTLGGIPFTSQQFTITATGDTANITSWAFASGGPQLTHESAVIDIAGFAPATFTIATHTWKLPGTQGGFGRNLGLNLLTLDEAAFAVYGLDTSILPISETTPLHVHQFQSVSTTRGSLSFSSIPSFTFEAVATDETALPEPSTSAMIVFSGLAAVTMATLRSWKHRGSRI